jgi:hypothetical protein
MQMQIDLDETFVEVENMLSTACARRSSPIRQTDAPPPPCRSRARIADRPKRSFDDPETLGLAERCLVGNFAPAAVPGVAADGASAAIPSFYRIVQTDAC